MSRTRFAALTKGKVSKDNKTRTNTNMLLGCLFFVPIDYASTLHTSVDAHGAGASTVPCNSLAVVNLRPCLVKNSLAPTCLVPGTKHGLEVIK